METFAGLSRKELLSYNYYIVAFSGGKDPVACFLHLLDMGVPKEKIELWHHLVYGRESKTFMDWPCTEGYCKRFAESFGVPIFFSWKQGGFEKEMLRDNEPTAKTAFEVPVRTPGEDNLLECGIETSTIGGNGKKNTRLKFPQVTADLKTRWCSAYLKISVCTSAVTNQKRFAFKKTLIISGERTEESPARAKYKIYEKDSADLRLGKKPRHVDRARPVHQWSEAEVWEIIKRYQVNPHPAYRLGWGRLSCMACIFGSKN